MALAYIKGREEIPENAKVLSEKEALSHQIEFIKRWQKPSEVFFLQNGGLIAATATALTSFPILHHFRKHLKLNTFGLISTYAPASLMPTCLTFLGYQKLVTSKILLMKTQCPLCMEFAYTAYHLSSSIFYTTTISAITCASIAIGRKTCYVPSPQTEGRLFVKFFWDILKAGSRKYQAITAFQLIVALFLPYLQVQEFGNLLQAAAEKERFETDSQDSFSSEILTQ